MNRDTVPMVTDDINVEDALHILAAALVSVVHCQDSSSTDKQSGRAHFRRQNSISSGDFSAAHAPASDRCE
jgi:hypothetical protein